MSYKLRYKFITNKKNMSSHNFECLLKQKIIEMQDKYIVIKYHINHDEYNHATGAYIKYHERGEQF